MQSEYSILSDGFKITTQGLTLVAGNQFHIYNFNIQGLSDEQVKAAREK